MYERENAPVRFTNTFKSSVIPGQERDLSSTPADRGVKLYSQDQEFWTRQAQEAAAPSAIKERPKSAMPVRNTDERTRGKSFLDLMNAGEGKTRVTPTFVSQVLPLTPSVPNLRKVNIDENNVANNGHCNGTTTKWSVDEVIPEKVNKEKQKTSDMYKMYLGLKDTPFQRYFKEHYGEKHQAPTASNVKKQKGNIGQTVSFNQYSTNKDVYKDLDAKARRAKEFDSCLWAENEGNYKSFQGKDMSQVDKNKLSANSTWKCKESATKHDNQSRTIDLEKATRDNLASCVLPMTEYPRPAKHEIPSFTDDLHASNYRKEYEARLKNPSKQKMMVTNSNWNDAKNEGLSSFNGYEKKSNIINLLNQSQNFRDPFSHQLTRSFDAAATGGIIHNEFNTLPKENSESYNHFNPRGTINVSGLRKQEMLASHFDNSNLYEKFINKKIAEGRNPQASQQEYIQSNAFTHKQLKQKFLEGQEDRFLFGESKRDHSAGPQTDVQVHTLELDHVPENLTLEDLKRNLKIKHLVSAELDTDNVKNLNKGKGKITFRTNTRDEKDQIQQKLHEIGIEAHDYEFKNKTRTARVGTSSIGFLDSKNEIDVNRGKRDRLLDEGYNYTSEPRSIQPKIRDKQKIAGKVGENLFIKPKDYLKNYQNDTKSKRANFCESAAELFGNTNGGYAKVHNEKLARDRTNFEKGEKDHRVQHQIIQGKEFMFQCCDWFRLDKDAEKV